MFASHFRFSLELNRECLAFFLDRVEDLFSQEVLICKVFSNFIDIVCINFGFVTDSLHDLLMSISWASLIATECHDLPLMLTVKAPHWNMVRICGGIDVMCCAISFLFGGHMQ